jgi:hypothetical protein
MALGRLLTIAANFLDPDVYFLGGGVVEAAPHFRDWFFAEVRANTVLREEQARAAEISLVPDLDMAGARGSAVAAREWVINQGPYPRPSASLSLRRPGGTGERGTGQAAAPPARPRLRGRGWRELRSASCWSPCDPSRGCPPCP